MDGYYGRTNSPVEQACHELRQLQRDYDVMEKYLEVVKADKNQTPKLFHSHDSYQDNCNWVTVSKRYLLTRIRAEKLSLEKRLKVAQAAYNRMERIAKSGKSK